MISAIRTLLLLLPLMATAASGPLDPGAREREEVEQLAPGRLLVAMPQLRDPNFQETVILLVDYGRRGAMGVVLNRPSTLTLNDALGGHELPRGQKLFFGGPVQSHRRLVLAASAQPLKNSLPLLPGLYLLHDADEVARWLQAPAAGIRFRVFSGYAGWGPQQLEHEIYFGDWRVLPASLPLVLDSLPEELWLRLIRYDNPRMALR
ncbi:YqgE/AlgH family protein [Motiliproteus sp. SC1-56]|uniref:YqgE/AlgH family protein n=1 Tax=Motiliproteus sp. SC1-56 TaxID=2799565 RepID=UPI001A8DB2BA|nr:YqgE/AlgH family protein [Motiliproteus sp. SC1-56]